MPVFCEKYLISDINSKMNGLIKTAFDCQKCEIYIYDNLRKELWSQYSVNSNSLTKLSCDKGIPGFVIKNKVNILLEDAYFDPRFNKDQDLKTGFRTRALMACPILTDENDVLGKFPFIIFNFKKMKE